MIHRNPGLGPRWLASDPYADVRAFHLREDAEAWERGEIGNKEADRRNDECERSDISRLYAERP